MGVKFYKPLSTHPSREQCFPSRHPSEMEISPFPEVCFQIASIVARIYFLLTVAAQNTMRKHRKEKSMSKTSLVPSRPKCPGVEQESTSPPTSKTNHTFQPNEI